MARQKIALFFMVVLLAGLAFGCGSSRKFNRQRYETIYSGQDRDRVEAMLGRPSATSDSSVTYINTRPFYQAVISFDEDGHVTSKAWYRDRQTAPPPPEEGIEVGGTIVIDSSTSSGTSD